LAAESKIDVANSEIDQSIDCAVDNSIEIIRNLANDLRPDMLAHLPLTAGLNEYARQYSRLSGLQILVVEKTPKPKLDEETRLVFFRAAQELLTNVTRHAQATKVEISMRSDNATCLVMEVSDDGVGIDSASINKRGSVGLLGIRERTEALGGSLTFRRNEGVGTTVSISIPIKQRDFGRS
jgi:two-component system, NarL family, sensor histidine kinase UhpB